MKKLFFILICALCTVAMHAQRYLRITKLDGSVTEIAVTAIDSIDFFTKSTTIPEPPVVNPSNPVENGHEYVDLGLPSGTLWAKMNIGATAITDYGDYFAWGETSPKKDADGDYLSYSLKTYKWYTSDTIKEVDADGFETITYDNKYTKYCTDASYGPVDNITQLELADDAAHVNWGGAWRMPTYDDIYELCTNCTWKWVTLNGVNGYKVSSNAEGNTNYIFLPAAGYRGGWGLSYDGSRGYYWSSSLYESCPYGAWGLYFNEGGWDTSNDSRYFGFPVRPVCSSAQE